jgi:AraC-like DNA-binding protein
LYVKRSITPTGTRKEIFHFILPALYLGYMILDYIQTNEFKYNSYINSYHPDWPLLKADPIINNDPLNIRKHLNLVTAIQIFLYTLLSLRLIIKKAAQSQSTILNTGDDVLRSIRNTVAHIFIIVIIFIIVKLNFRADLGDYFIGLYISFFALLTTIRVMNDSAYFDRTASFVDLSVGKYRKSSLTETDKKRILAGIEKEFDSNSYFEDNLASLSDLSKKLGESPHHVSQVINEGLKCNFFELLARYRIEKAMKIFSEDLKNKLTVEEVSEMVGYNSRTAFNNAFRKITGKTPSEFRNT